jgi:type II secretory pathway component PulK
VVLLVVLFFALLLSASVVTFLRRSTVDSMIARNRDSAAQADALARGGVRLAEALLPFLPATDTWIPGTPRTASRSTSPRTPT